MYFWIAIVWMFRPTVFVFFHYVHRFFFKYKTKTCFLSLSLILHHHD